MTSFICSYFHIFCFPASFIVFDSVQSQKVPDDKAICPSLPCPGLHPLCPHDFVWVLGSNSQQHHIANTFFLFQLLAGQVSEYKYTDLGPWDISFDTDQMEYVICFGCSHDTPPKVLVSLADGAFFFLYDLTFYVFTGWHA